VTVARAAGKGAAAANDTTTDRLARWGAGQQRPTVSQFYKGGLVSTASLSGYEIAHIVESGAVLAGLDSAWVAHSLGSGFVTEAGRQEKPQDHGEDWAPQRQHSDGLLSDQVATRQSSEWIFASPSSVCHPHAIAHL